MHINILKEVFIYSYEVKNEHPKAIFNIFHLKRPIQRPDAKRPPIGGLFDN